MLKQYSYPYQYRGETIASGAPPEGAINENYVVTWDHTLVVGNWYTFDPSPLDRLGFVRLFTLLIFEDDAPSHYYYELEISQTFQTDYASDPLRVPWIGVPPAFDAPQSSILELEMVNKIAPFDSRILVLIPPRVCTEWPPPES